MAEPGALAPLELDSPPERVPVYAFPENAARALGKIAAYAGWRSQPPALFWSFDDIHAADARDIAARCSTPAATDWLTGEETRRVLNISGCRSSQTVVAPTADDAAALAAAFGFPVVAKLVSRQLLHKSDAGAVRVGLSSDSAVRLAFEELTALAGAHGGINRAEGEGVGDSADDCGRCRNHDWRRRRSSLWTADRVRPGWNLC